MQVLEDLKAEHTELDRLVGSIENLDQPSAAEGWSIRSVIAHLAYYDRVAATAIRDPEGFQTLLAQIMDAAVEGGMDAIDALTLGWAHDLERDELLHEWQLCQAALEGAASGLDPNFRIPWFGPSMGAQSFLTARLMEAWVHGWDIADAVHARVPATDRLRHIAHLGFITRGWSYRNRGLDKPDADVQVRLTAPSGDDWIFGEGDEFVEGSAEDFCLVVAQRRHVDDTALKCSQLGRDWMLKAQCFAGPPTDGPQPKELNATR